MASLIRSRKVSLFPYARGVAEAVIANFVRVDRLCGGEDPAAWEEELSSVRLDPARAFKVDGGVGVYPAKIMGRDVVVKVWDMSSFWSRVKSWARVSRAWRHWRGAVWLAENGILTARPFVLARDRGPRGHREWLVMERLDGPTLLDVVTSGKESTRREHALAAAAADQVSAMVGRGRYNRDHKPSNLVVGSRETGEPTLAVIDCVAILPCRRFDFGAMRRMLFCLAIEPMGVGRPVRRSLCMRALTTIQAGSWWSEIAGMVVSHGDPRPRFVPRDASSW